MPLLIEDYALIGDCHTAALVGRNGSIDWLCMPRFDSGACFAALLGTPENGYWKIAPAVDVRSTRRRYCGDTLILETDFECDHGAVTLSDFMPPRTAAPDVIRTVRGRRGQVPMHMELVIRFDYGSIVPWIRKTQRGVRATAGPDTLQCRSNAEVRHEGDSAVADFTVSKGQDVSFSLTWSETHKEIPQERDPGDTLRETEQWWTKWVQRCTYRGEHRDAALRSLLTLKALTYAPTGGIVAAPTTSLPEELGGVRNWDYRYCWVRDATFTLYALLVGGYVEEAAAWREWLIRAVAGTPSQLQIMYGVAGERRLTEIELPWLMGYEGSAPVRCGNAAHQQLQLDVYGEIMDVMKVARRAGLRPTDDGWRVQRALLDFLETGWKQPDEGIWEVRGPRRHFTHSKVMTWAAVDRGIRAVRDFELQGDLSKWCALRDEIREDVLRNGYDSELSSFVQSYGSKDPDASLLTIPLVGFIQAGDPRMRGTVEYIERRLLQSGFINRYPTRRELDGLPGAEGAFLPCSFWYADNLALQGRAAEARQVLERLLDIRNDVGLLSEEYDPVRKRLLGNFPQAFSHVGLVNTIRNLSSSGGPAEDRQAESGS